MTIGLPSQTLWEILRREEILDTSMKNSYYFTTVEKLKNVLERFVKKFYESSGKISFHFQPGIKRDIIAEEEKTVYDGVVIVGNDMYPVKLKVINILGTSLFKYAVMILSNHKKKLLSGISIIPFKDRYEVIYSIKEIGEEGKMEEVEKGKMTVGKKTPIEIFIYHY